MIRIAAGRSDEGTPFVHHWSHCVGAGRANEGLRADWQAHLLRAKAKCGFRYVRFHGLFHDDMFVLRNGVHNFQYVDALFDALLKIGVRPFVAVGEERVARCATADFDFFEVAAR